MIAAANVRKVRRFLLPLSDRMRNSAISSKPAQGNKLSPSDYGSLIYSFPDLALLALNTAKS